MALIHRFFEARGKADLDAIDELLAPDFVSHTKMLFAQEPDREAYKRAIAELYATFSNVSLLVEDQVAGGDKVVTRWTFRGTHDRRELMGVAPTTSEVAYKAITIHRICGGKIAEEWGIGTSVSNLTAHRLEQEMRERVEQELRVARRIQKASLPKEVPQLEGWQISPFYRPAREVGGDFYD